MLRPKLFHLENQWVGCYTCPNERPLVWLYFLYGRIYVDFPFLTVHKVCTKARLLGERSVRIREVKGSNPSRSIKRRIVLNDTAFLFVLGSCFFNTAAHRDVIQASCYPITSKTNYTTIVFKKFCITTRTRQGRPKPFLEREGFGFFVFGGVPRRTTKASAAHGRAASAQAQCAADAYFLCRAPSPDGKVRASAAF